MGHGALSQGITAQWGHGIQSDTLKTRHPKNHSKWCHLAAITPLTKPLKNQELIFPDGQYQSSFVNSYPKGWQLLQNFRKILKMKIDRNKTNTFTIDFDSYPVVGFHASSSLACTKIERAGFLPDKILARNEHDQILSEAKSLSIDTDRYEEWLQMRSVTFAKKCSIALSHLASGNSGGQGLLSIIDVLVKIQDLGDGAQKSMAVDYSKRIQVIQDASSVIYAVDLSNLGERLVQDYYRPDLFQVYFDTKSPLPAKSIVQPLHIIARLDVW